MAFGASLAVLVLLGWIKAAHTLKHDECNASAETDADVQRTCADFCAGRCSFFNASAGETPTPKNLTIYRLTPRNVTDLVDHDTGDPPGDIGFFLSEKSLHAECLRDPDNIACFLAGDNVYGSWIVEVDGKFGPYHMCNPVAGNASGSWECLQYCETPPHCAPWSQQRDSANWMGPNCFCARSNRTVGRVQRTSHHTNHGNVPAWWPTKTCSVDAHMFYPSGYCLNSTIYKTLPHALASECCDACGADADCRGWVMKHGAAVKNASAPGKARATCSLLREPFSYTRVDAATSACISAYKPGGGAGHISGGVLGGFWYSTPRAGKCGPGQRPGDASGCTWRIVETVKFANASCVNAKVDRAVEHYARACFDGCAGGVKNVTSRCYLDCYAAAVNGNATIPPISHREIEREWLGAFASDDVSQGGCPRVHVGGAEVARGWRSGDNRGGNRGLQFPVMPRET